MGDGGVYLIRHAEADYDVIAPHDPVFVGARRDFAPLTSAGAAQAQLVAVQLRASGLRLVASSPYTRALQTAALVAKELNCEIVVDVRLHDWLPVRDARMPISASVVADRIGEYERSVATGVLPVDRTWETSDEMRDRLLAVIADFKDRCPLAIIAHEAPIQSVIGPVGVPVASIHRLDLADVLTGQVG